MERYRSRGALSTTVTKTDYTAPSPTCTALLTQVLTSSSAWRAGYFEDMFDTVTPNWSRKLASGQLVFNNMLKRIKDYKVFGSSSYSLVTIPTDCSPPQRRTYSGSGQIGTYGLLSGNTPVTLPLIPSPEVISLRTEVWTKCRADRQKGAANLFESLAEADQAVGLFSKPFGAAIAFVSDFKRRHKGKKLSVYKARKSFGSGAQALSSEYLSWRYGLSPIISDSKAILKALKSVYKDEVTQIASRANGTRNDSSASYLTIDLGAFTTTYQITRSHIHSVRGVYIDRYRVTPWTDLGFTFQNLVGLPWELLNKSFVADWFVNLGDFLYANIPRLDVVAMGGCLTSLDERRVIYTPILTTIDAPSTWYSSSATIGDGVQMLDSYKSRIDDSNLNTGIVFKNDFRLDHFTRTMDALALVVKAVQSVHFTKRPS